jgi:ribonuclease BN (tRNA processing enzyme)
MSQLDVILFTHFHVDHSADFPSLIFSSWLEQRPAHCPYTARRATASSPRR